MGRWVRVILVGLVLGLVANWYVRTRVFAPRPPAVATVGASLGDLGAAYTDVATNLEIPWEVAFLPGGDFLVTERPGRLTRLAPDGVRRWTTSVPGVRHSGEGGLLGLALDPLFSETGHIYLYLTSEDANRVERWHLSEEGELSNVLVLLDGIPSAWNHDGGRLLFGSDSTLFISTGDAGAPSSARSRSTLAGKILRLNRDGSVPADNPFGSPVWSLGHRNPQGLAWDEQGRLWSTEHGRSGVRSGLDEVNLVVRGADYGWPEVQGDDGEDGVTSPVLHSGPRNTWAPSGAAWLDGRLFFGGLRGQALYEVRSPGTSAELVVHFFGEFGRIRQVRVGPDGMLYILTGNLDGRGRPRDGDDRLVRLDPRALTGAGPREP